MLATVVPRLGMLLGQHGVQAIAAGLLSGAVLAGAGVATGVIPVAGAQAAPTIALLACPGSGPELGRISSGQTLLATARSADGHWLEVYVGEPGVSGGWVPAARLRLESAADGLPVHGCDVPVALASQPNVATVGPSATVIATLLPSTSTRPTQTPKPSSTPKPSGTPKPTPSPKPTPKPTPTPVPTSYKDPNPPVVSDLSASDNCLPAGFGENLAVTATDPDDGASGLTVALRIDPVGLAPYDGDPFTPNYDGTSWEGYLQPIAGWTSGYVRWTVIVTDVSGNTTAVASSANNTAASYIWYDTTACPTGGP